MARRIRIERHEGYRLVVGFAAPGAAATTVWSTIFMRPRAVGNARLLRHELVHVRQWHAHGVVGFVARYLGSYLLWRLRRHPHWAAYRRIPFEVEAEWTARRTAPAPARAGAATGPAAAEPAGGVAGGASGDGEHGDDGDGRSSAPRRVTVRLHRSASARAARRP
jgi:hypothetical protein